MRAAAVVTLAWLRALYARLHRPGRPPATVARLDRIATSYHAAYPPVLADADDCAPEGMALPGEGTDA